LQDDPQAALDAIERAVAGGVTTPLYLNTQPAMDAFWALQGAIRLAGIAASIHVSTATVNGAAVSTSAASSSAPNVTNVTLNLPRGTRPDDTVRSLDRWTRRNGRSHAARR
jgi:L-alanine-DL-glutamate epimerase-like enolase superfamily enzyme